MTADVERAVRQAIADIRHRFGPWATEEGRDGAFMAGPQPKKGEFHFAATVYSGRSDAEIDKMERWLPYPTSQSGAHIPDPLRTFYAAANGLRVLQLAIFGDYSRMEPGVGAPIGLNYGSIERPPGVPETWFGFGSINGRWYAQGILFLVGGQDVRLVHSEDGRVGAVWPDFGTFLVQEVNRQIDIHDPDGDLRPGASPLPGDTEDWEISAKAASDERNRRETLPRRLLDRLRGKQDD